MKHARLRTISAALVATAALGLSACGDDTTDATDTTGSSAGSTGSPSAQESVAPAQADQVSVEDPWVKAADSGMTAAFGTLVNSGDSDVVVTAASSDVTGMMELHETVESADGGMVMQPVEGGFTVPASGTHELAPGGDHLMMMDLLHPVLPGDSVTVVLTMEDGSTTEFTAVVKEFSGADEDYQGDMDMDHDQDQDRDREHAG